MKPCTKDGKHEEERRLVEQLEKYHRESLAALAKCLEIRLALRKYRKRKTPAH